MDWIVYVLLSRDAGTTYVGISNDAKRRLAQHNGKIPGGAKATRGGRPWRIGALYGPYDSRAMAQRVEHVVKAKRGRERLHVDGEPSIVPPRAERGS